MTLPVFLAEQVQPEFPTLQVGQKCVLSGPQAHHAANVVRLQVGEGYDLVDGAGRRVRCEVSASGKDRLEGVVCEVITESLPDVKLVLVQALAKGGRDEQAIEAATEIGVDQLIPWQASRSIARWTGAKVEKGRSKWLQVTQAAAKQSRRAWWPSVQPLVSSKQLTNTISQVSDKALVLLLHESAQVGLLGAVMDADLVRPLREVWVIVGPEGGITEDEVADFTACGAIPVRLGPNILRSATAGPAALAVLAAHLGRWNWQKD